VGITNVGVAAVFSTFKFRNPINSGVVAVFEKISANSGANDFVDIQVGTDQTDGNTIVALTNQNNLDARSNRISSLIFSRSGAAAPVSQSTIARIFAGSTITQDFIGYQNQEISLLPGRSLQLVSGTAAVTLISSFKWRERLLEESERT
jgi:hypothetical protein